MRMTTEVCDSSNKFAAPRTVELYLSAGRGEACVFRQIRDSEFALTFSWDGPTQTSGPVH